MVDFNLVWHHGLPIRTGQHKPGKDALGEPRAQRRFPRGATGGLPDDWQWQIKTAHAARGARRGRGPPGAADRSGVRSDEGPRTTTRSSSAASSPPGPATPTGSRRAMKATHPDAKAALMLQGYEANVFFWANWPNEIKVGTEWKEHEFVFRIPGPRRAWVPQGDEALPRPGRRSRRERVAAGRAMSRCMRSRCSASGRRGRPSAWTGTRRSPTPSSSIRSMPIIRLKPDSPAFALGFKPIPVEKIGPYQDESRASWPIVEAPGAREHPVKPPG